MTQLMMTGTLAQTSDGGNPIAGLIVLAIMIVAIAGHWAMFSKAGQPGWGILIPFFNIYLMCKVAGRPGWWLVLYLIPLVNIAISAVVSVDIANRFDRGALFGIGIFLLPFIFVPILGFGSATYQGEGAAAPAPQPA